MPDSLAGGAVLTVAEGDQGEQVPEIVDDGWGRERGRERREKTFWAGSKQNMVVIIMFVFIM